MRERKRQGTALVSVPATSSPSAQGTGGAATSPQGPAANAGSSSSPLHETSPVTGPGPEAFASPPVFAANENGKPEPFVPLESEAPKPPPTPEEVAPMVAAVVMYFQAGCIALLKTHGDELGKFVSVDQIAGSLPKASEFVRGSTERVAIKYGIRGLPYQDEIIVAGAIGVATFGFVGKPKKPTDKQQAGPNAGATRVASPPPNARNANTPTEPDDPVSPPQGDFKL